MKPLIAPSILSSDPGRLREAVEAMIEGGADRIHFDVMDGQFVPPITFGADLVRSVRDLGGLPFEAHLMTLTPEAHVQPFVEAGCDLIIFHAEATVHGHRLAQAIRRAGAKAGVAINPGTPSQALEGLLEEIDLALIMTVNPGWGGQAFIPATLEKVRSVRKLRPDLDIEVDGGIDPTTIPSAWESGANVFVAGSFLAKQPSVGGGIRALREACG